MKNIEFTFTIEEVNLVLDALLDKPARATRALINRIEAEAIEQLKVQETDSEDAKEDNE
jgi:hypothetical protein